MVTPSEIKKIYNFFDKIPMWDKEDLYNKYLWENIKLGEENHFSWRTWQIEDKTEFYLGDDFYHDLTKWVESRKLPKIPKKIGDIITFVFACVFFDYTIRFNKKTIIELYHILLFKYSPLLFPYPKLNKTELTRFLKQFFKYETYKEDTYEGTQLRERWDDYVNQKVSFYNELKLDLPPINQLYSGTIIKDWDYSNHLNRQLDVESPGKTGTKKTTPKKSLFIKGKELAKQIFHYLEYLQAL